MKRDVKTDAARKEESMKIDTASKERNLQNRRNADIKVNLSVFGLFARCSIFKVLGILLLMSVVQIALFAKTYFLDSSNGSVGTLESYIQASGIPVVCALELALVTFLLCLAGTEYSSKTGYTIKRLAISERSTFFHQAVYNMMVYVLFGAVQIVVIFVIGKIFGATVPEKGFHEQILFLAFYRDEFLHALLPLEDVMLWVRNVVWIIALGMAAAEFPYIQRRGKKMSIAVIFMLAMAIVFGKCEIGSFHNCIITIFAAGVVVLCILCCTIFRKEDQKYDS